MSAISQVGIVGAGTMGHGIAHVAALAGFEVRLFLPSAALGRTGEDRP